MNILGVHIDTYSREESLSKAEHFLDSDSQHLIFTPNPEMLVAARTDNRFRAILNRGSLNLCDGKGIQLVTTETVERIPGTDFMLDLCQLATRKNKSVYFLGSNSIETLEQLKVRLNKKIPSLKIAGCHPGPTIREIIKEGDKFLDLDERDNDDILANIVLTAPDILFVAFGHPKQEKWIDIYLADLPSVKIAMGVGGAFDYLSGIVRRAPRFIQHLGLEWLWRVGHEPKRLKRIITATLIFPWLYFTTKK